MANYQLSPTMPTTTASISQKPASVTPNADGKVFGGVDPTLMGVLAGFLPGGRDWGTSGDSSGWTVYLFAVTILVVATRAVHGGKVALRLLLVLALIFFVERAFSPFALRVIDPVVLGLHGLAAFVALAVALSAASAIRGSRVRPERDVQSLEAA